MKHLLSIEDVSREEHRAPASPARRSFAEVSGRPIKKVPRAPAAARSSNLFYEASTRTSSSFELAAKRLSADVINVQVERLLGREGASR